MMVQVAQTIIGEDRQTVKPSRSGLPQEMIRTCKLDLCFPSFSRSNSTYSDWTNGTRHNESTWRTGQDTDNLSTCWTPFGHFDQPNPPPTNDHFSNFFNFQCSFPLENMAELASLLTSWGIKYCLWGSALLRNKISTYCIVTETEDYCFKGFYPSQISFSTRHEG